MHNSRVDVLFLAKVFDQAERYEEIAQLLKEIVQSDVELSPDERSLLSVAYKNMMGSKRNAWRIISSLQLKYENTSQSEMIKNYRIKIRNEIVDLGNEVLQLLDQHLIPSNQSDNVSAVFFQKMKADYYRYIAELFINDENEFGKKVTENCLETYNLAKSMAENFLPVTHPVRLGLILNFSVFCTEIMKDYELGRQMAERAFHEAVSELETLSEEFYYETITILQLLR
ncbi:14-3-3 like protein [Naegleria gruberi]|uniref:14-3-3 like protein n=1 Tax=Naegleria gruberi TaxID=5762 RepID=D2VP84_NAEGR|nr:14-3-3 like protein [Naegleria gruberi]EFC41386.1 14-3-3 like protein [Naegleria gruberi]|eukprot:XP_002674130.1 14-3-3 like protein [Naegleria gruberi strain NEG-M]